MSRFMNRGARVLTVKVTNLDSGREDVHKNISREEAEWIDLNPNLKVEVVEVSLRAREKRNSEEAS